MRLEAYRYRYTGNTSRKSDTYILTILFQMMSYSGVDYSIYIHREKPIIPHITIDDDDIETVNTCTLLGITQNEWLSWHNHIDKMYKKACQSLHFILQL